MRGCVEGCSIYQFDHSCQLLRSDCTPSFAPAPRRPIPPHASCSPPCVSLCVCICHTYLLYQATTQPPYPRGATRQGAQQKATTEGYSPTQAPRTARLPPPPPAHAPPPHRLSHRVVAPRPGDDCGLLEKSDLPPPRKNRSRLRVEERVAQQTATREGPPTQVSAHPRPPPLPPPPSHAPPHCPLADPSHNR